MPKESSFAKGRATSELCPHTGHDADRRRGSGGVSSGSKLRRLKRPNSGVLSPVGDEEAADSVYEARARGVHHFGSDSRGNQSHMFERAWLQASPPAKPESQGMGIALYTLCAICYQTSPLPDCSDQVQTSICSCLKHTSMPSDGLYTPPAVALHDQFQAALTSYQGIRWHGYEATRCAVHTEQASAASHDEALALLEQTLWHHCWVCRWNAGRSPCWFAWPGRSDCQEALCQV